MVFFTTPELLEIGGCRSSRRTTSRRGSRRCATTGASSTPSGCRFRFTRKCVRSSARRSTATRSCVTTRTAARRRRACAQARAVVLAIGYYDLPNYLGVPGEDLPHVSHYYTDAHPYYRQRVVVVGGKNSAAEAALELFRGRRARDARASPCDARRLDQVLGAARHREPDQGRLDRGALRDARRRDSRRPRSSSSARARPRTIPAEGVFLLTGYHPDAELMRRAGVECDAETLAPDARSGDVRDATCRTCSRRRRGGRAGTPATSSSRTAAFTASGSSRSSPTGGCRRPERPTTSSVSAGSTWSSGRSGNGVSPIPACSARWKPFHASASSPRRACPGLRRRAAGHRIQPDHLPAVHRGVHDRGARRARSHRVLEIGTGSAYQAAVLASLAREVWTIEIVPELAAAASELLRIRPDQRPRPGMATATAGGRSRRPSTASW